ncbi:hypothetical protein H6F67_00225 [Microcoleus sp. FACHB-1515]|uniref:hypothetical protein n=1 Tax=Cyanophyceae TaxID=3028117 RepID=UPI001681D02F|nr:hypothetical protein [Microcoleus sp. FACHB-1515]MBD2088301.1 hypothetical protein [Microcoleus sp. FACHB-1515]
MAVPDTSQKKCRPSIEIYCESLEQKQQIKTLATQRGLSVSQFLIQLAFANGRDVGARRRSEEVLTNADLYRQLIELNQTLQAQHQADPTLLKAAIDLLDQLGQELVLKRLEHRAQQLVE